MPKLSKFKKALKLAEKANQHFFHNCALNHKTEAIDVWQTEGILNTIKREKSCGQRAHYSRLPKGNICTSSK